MPDFQIFTDSSADIPLKTAEQKNIKVIPFYISFNSQNYYKELFEMPRHEFFSKLIDEKLFPKTSLPSIQDFIDAFTPSLEEGRDIICFCITDTLSGAYHSALSAREILKEKYTDSGIYIINSWTATGAAQLMIWETCRMRDNGFSAEKAFEICEKMKKETRIMFMVGALTHFEKGGRIGKLAALSGGILKIKPLIDLKGGEVTVAGAVRSRKNGIKRLADITNEHFKKYNENPKNYYFTVGTTNTPEEVPLFTAELQKTLPAENFYPPFEIGATIASHTGPDTIGVCFVKKYENYLI